VVFDRISTTVLLPLIVQERFAREIKLFFEIFQAHRAEFGFRVVHEASRFINAYKMLGGYDDVTEDWFSGAFDAVVVQKLLPKLHGSRARLEGLLWALFWACAAPRGEDPDEFRNQCLAAGRAEDESKYSPEGVNTAAGKITYPLSADKLLRMWQRLTQDQFVSFAEA
jgi:5-methylcytosine-specific restriction protein B